MREGIIYWKRESIADGRILALYKTVNTPSEYRGYFYKHGQWNETDDFSKLGWDSDYDAISEAEALEIIGSMDL